MDGFERAFFSRAGRVASRFSMSAVLRITLSKVLNIGSRVNGRASPDFGSEMNESAMNAMIFSSVSFLL